MEIAWAGSDGYGPRCCRRHTPLGVVGPKVLPRIRCATHLVPGGG